MAIRVALSHRTTYRFDRHVNLGPHEIRLRPAPHCRTPVLGYSLTVMPEPRKTPRRSVCSKVNLSGAT